MLDSIPAPYFNSSAFQPTQIGRYSLLPRSVADRTADLTLDFSSKPTTSIPQLSIHSFLSRHHSLQRELAEQSKHSTLVDLKNNGKANVQQNHKIPVLGNNLILNQRKPNPLQEATLQANLSINPTNPSTLLHPSYSTTTDPLTGLPATAPLAVNTQTTDRLLNAGNLASTPILHVKGSLRADRFTYNSSHQRVIFSGKGNTDFGSGYRDWIDLSNIHSSTVRFNLASNQGGGIVFNPGNGPRVFDAITLNNGRQILFEGIDSARFANGTLNLTVVPNDPLFSRQEGLHSMGVHNAWRFTTGSNRVLVGVQDSGLGTQPNGAIHPDLRTTTVFRNNYQDNFTRSSESHGTGVEGIIAARSNNGMGMSGINWNSNVFHIDVLNREANSQTLEEATRSMIAEAARNGQRLVINMSLGIPGTFNQNFHTSLANVIANNPNTLFVISAGNSGHEGRSGLASPAVLAQRFNNVIAVGASWLTQDRNGVVRMPGQRIQYADWGSQYGPGLTLMGPSEVISTRATRNIFGQVQFGYHLTGERFDGTSAAAPNVAGVASLMWSANPQLSAGQIKGILAQTAYRLGGLNNPTLYGNGFVNADAAVRQAMAYARV